MGAALVGRTVLYSRVYWWPDDDVQRGTDEHLSFSHVLAYTRQTSALRGTADTLLDAASGSDGSPCVLLSPARAAGVATDRVGLTVLK